MRRRLLIAVGLSLLLHAGVVTTTRDEGVWNVDARPAWLPSAVEFASIDEVLVLSQEVAEPLLYDERAIEEMDCAAEDPILSDDVEEGADSGLFFRDDRTIGIGATRVNANAPFEGPGLNSTIGIGGGAGGAFGGRRGGRRNLRAGGGGRRMGAGVAWPKERLRLVARIAGEQVGEFPLRGTSAVADVTAWMASTRLTQTFANPFDQEVEAVYVFPLPSNAAVSAFEMVVAGRRILGVVRTREEAEQVYAEARRAGKTASLLTQERPNVFTLSLANIAAGESVDVEVTYFHGLRYDHGAYEYMLPTVVAPRYSRAADPTVAAGGVPGAESASMPAFPSGARSGAGVDLTVNIDAGVTIDEVGSPTHAITTQLDGSRATVTLAEGGARPDGDIVIRWKIAGDEVQAGFVAHRTAHGTDSRGGFFSAFLVPMLDPSGAEVGAREVTFVLDTSGSMRGIPMNTSRALVERSLAQMRSYDRFNIIRFAGSSGSFAEAPVAATPANIASGIEYVRELKGGGGTEMLKGIRRWITLPADTRYLRTVVFLTDGLVSAEEEILATIRDEGQAARWFAFGIGSSVNRHLIEGIALHGNGAHEIVVPGRGDGAAMSNALAAADRLIERFDAPLLLDLQLDTNGLPIEGVLPARLPDLFAGQPVVVFGRYTGAASGTLLFRGSVGGREIVIPVQVELPADAPANEGLAAMWARTRVDDLETALLGSEGASRTSLLAQIETLGLDHQLVTRRTAFVAVDESRIVGDGFPIRLLQHAELPRNVRYWGDVGAPPGTEGALVEHWGLTVADAEDGEVMVARVARRGRAARAGLSRGFVIESIDGHPVRGVRHFRALLEQVDGRDVKIGYRNGAGVAVRDVNLARW